MKSSGYRTMLPDTFRGEVKKEWLLVNAEGKILGRLASLVARLIRGKHKPSFTPHLDCGDHVIVVNAEKVALSGKKGTDKEHMRYSGYPGGLRRLSPAKILSEKPSALVEMAVKGMLPRNRLGRKVYGNLHVYAGTEHPHQAQNPKPLNTDI